MTIACNALMKTDAVIYIINERTILPDRVQTTWLKVFFLVHLNYKHSFVPL